MKLETYIVRVNNGFSFEYFGTIEASSIPAARKIFLREHAGAWYANAKAFRISRR